MNAWMNKWVFQRLLTHLIAQLHHWTFSGLELQSGVHSLNYHLVLSLCYEEGLGALCDVTRCVVFAFWRAQGITPAW